MIVTLDRFKLVINSDPRLEIKKLRWKAKNNEIYIRAICWLNNDFSSAQYYPPKAVLEKNSFLNTLPILRMGQNDDLQFTEPIVLCEFDAGCSFLQEEKDAVKEKLKHERENLTTWVNLLEKEVSLHLTDRIATIIEKVEQIVKFEIEIDGLLVKKTSLEKIDHPTDNQQAELKNVIDQINRKKNAIKNIENIIEFLKSIKNEGSVDACFKNVQKIQENIVNLAKECQIITKKLSLSATKSRINYIIQVCEDDSEFRGDERIKFISTTTSDITKNVLDFEKAKFDVLIAKMKEEDPNFNVATVLDPTLLPKTIVDSVLAGVEMIDNFMKRNPDDVVFTAMGAIAAVTNPPKPIKIKNSCIEMDLTLH